MSAERALLYARTLRTLRPTQVLGRVWRAVHRPRPDLAPAPPRRAARAPWTPGAERAASWLSPTRRRFLGVEREVADAAAWDDPADEKLWRYNLHYFDDLRAADAPARAAWHAAGIARWIAENPPGDGTGWEPYCVSLRVVNWVRWALAGGALDDAAVHSLAVQVRHLRGDLEYHLLGNHLWSNAKALVFAGCFFEGAEAEGWLERGLALLARELDEQVLEDGGHFERSPMYHALALEDLLDLLNLAAVFPRALPARRLGEVARWREAARRMRDWLALMTHPDGDLALFNDAAFDVAPRPDALHAYARRLGLGPLPLGRPGLHLLADSGYARLETADAVALLDVGALGPRYLPGHAHADTLSFELSLHGRRVVVDTGTSTYAAGAERLRQRATAAHNTLEVDGRDSSEVWSSFRVARRAEPQELTVAEHRGELRVSCAHDGYQRLPGRVTHARTWTLRPGELVVEDRLHGRFQRAVGRLHLHPDVSGAAPDALRLADGAPLGCALHGAAARLEPSTWHPAFGAALANQRLVYELDADRAALHLTW